MTRRTAIAGTCPKCRQPVLAGMDQDTVALSVVVDPAALTRTGELLAVISGRRTYELDSSGHLHRRDRWAIRSAVRRPVAEHRCADPPPATWHLPPSPPRPAPSTECEF